MICRFLLVLPLVLISAVRTLEAQDLELAIEPEAQGVLSCESGFTLGVWLRNATPPVAVGGYQVFLRFPADHFEPLRFEPLEMRSSVFLAGPPPFADGFAPCAVQAQVGGEVDAWDDRRGEDVVAVVATVLSSVEGEPSAEPVSGAEVLLGRLFFRPTGVPAAAGQAAFSLNTNLCNPPLNQTTRLFDVMGNMLPATTSGEFAVEVFDGSFVVRELTCTVEVPLAVALSWQLPEPPVNPPQALRIYRNGGLIATLDPSSTSFRDVNPGAIPSATYEVVPLLEGEREGCGTGCGVSLILFRRGDANRDGRVNVSDAVAILRHLFQGEQVRCEDAADPDDTGQIVLTDAIFLLTFLFRSGLLPEPPFPEPGLDPTPDALGCAG